jgi:hypothetical protein
MILPQSGEKQVDVFDSLDLSDDHVDICEKPIRVMVVQDVHINPLVPTRQERVVVLLLFDAASYRREH